MIPYCKSNNLLMKKITLFFAFLFSISMYSQNIRGIVKDITNNTNITDANVYIKNTNKGAFTTNGKFKIYQKRKLKESDSLVVSHIGYKTVTISLKNYQRERLIISLEPTNQHLNEITISSTKKLRRKLPFKKLTSLDKGLYAFGAATKNDKIYVVGGDESDNSNDLRQELVPERMDKYPMTEMNNIDFRVLLDNFAQNSFSWKGYNNQLYIYNIANNSWEKSDIKLDQRANNVAHFYKDELIVLGGKRLSKNKRFEYLKDEIEIVNTDKNKVTVDKTNPHKAVNFASALVNEHIVVMGGSIKRNMHGEKTYSDKIHSFNLKTGKWFEIGKMTMAKESKGILIGNKIYLVGGFNKKALNTIESFDLNSGKWTKETELFEAVGRPGLAYKNDTVYIFNNNKLSTFNVHTKTLNEYTIDLPIVHSELILKNDKLFIVGGRVLKEYNNKPSASIYSIDLNEFDNTMVRFSKTNSDLAGN